MLNRIVDKKILDGANVYILDNKIIKYRGGSLNRKDVRYMFGWISPSNPLNLKDFTFGDGSSIADYGFSELDVESHICDLILEGKDLVWKNNKHIDIYTTQERRHRYDDCIRIADEFNMLSNVNIIIRGAERNDEE